VVKFWGAALCATLLWAPGAAAQTTFFAESDKKAIALGDLLSVKVTLKSTEQGTIPSPRFSPFGDFRVVSQATNTSVAYVGGKREVQVVFIFVLAPQKAGVLVIPPQEITVGGRRYRTEPLSIEVANNGSADAHPPTDAPTERVPGNDDSPERRPEQQDPLERWRSGGTIL
jgi:hypothetical protein